MRGQSSIAAIDAGGTSFKCAIVQDNGSILKQWAVNTSAPDETIEACIAAFQSAISEMGTGPVALGIASFGPVELDRTSSDFGTITGTAKPGWQGTQLGRRLAEGLDLPFYLDSDVNAALAAEQRWGEAKAIESAAYMTVGTGIGMGLYINGAFAGRPAHPEFGHVRVERHPQDQAFQGICALHGDCLEGLASASAVTARWGDPRQLSTDDIAWEIEAFYLGQACLNLYLTTRVQRILIGGGLMNVPGLVTRTQDAFDKLLGGYLPILGSDLICFPGLGAQAGVLGAATVALNALN
ncbi:MAG: ROK family protein [Pseudomonadota bacterium]